MQVKSIDVTDYSTGSQYVYTDRSGSWQSIKAVDGDTNGNGNAGGNNGGSDNSNDDSNDSNGGNDGGDDGEDGSGPDPGSPTVTEGPSVITDPILSTGMETDRTEYPWVPNPTDTRDSGSPVTSYAGLPSDWTVTDTGRVLPPSSASVSELPPSYLVLLRRHPFF